MGAYIGWGGAAGGGYSIWQTRQNKTDLNKLEDKHEEMEHALAKHDTHIALLENDRRAIVDALGKLESLPKLVSVLAVETKHLSTKLTELRDEIKKP